jgi:hypothetical protein
VRYVRRTHLPSAAYYLCISLFAAIWWVAMAAGAKPTIGRRHDSVDIHQDRGNGRLDQRADPGNRNRPGVDSPRSSVEAAGPLAE